MFKPKTQLGLDIGEKRIKLVEISKQSNRYQVVGFGSAETPPGVFEGGFITDPRRMGEALGRLVQEAWVNKSAPLVSAVSGQSVYTRLFSLPRMKMEELRSAALYQAGGFLPLNIDEVTADVYPVREYTDSEGEKTELFFVAARRTQVDGLFEACSGAGLKLKWVEIEPLGLARVYQRHLADAGEKAGAVVSIGANRSYIAFYRDGMLVLLRTINFGFTDLFEDKESVALEDLLGINAEGEQFAAGMEDLVQELSRSLSYCQIQLKAPVDSLVLTGGGSRVPGIGEFLGRSLGVGCQVGRLGEHLLPPPGLKESQRLELEHEYPVAMGLALRGWF